MGLRWYILPVAVGVAVASYYGLYCSQPQPLPKLDPDPYWGPGERPLQEDTSVRPFIINTPQEAVDDLYTRLSLPPRLTPALANTNFTYGFNTDTLEKILNYWRKEYDWRVRERQLNTMMNYKTRIEGLDIHFLRASPSSKTEKIVRPLLMVHGWPGSVVEFYDVIPLLTTPRPDVDVVFDVICPSLPGYGFSDAAAKPGLSVVQVGQIMVKLMSRLGFETFYAQGGDWGSAVVTTIATVYPDKLLGVHVNFFTGAPPLSWAQIAVGSLLPSGVVVSPQHEWMVYPLGNRLGQLLRETGYLHLQATKPDTVGVALNSSPQGLAAYILEKFSSWTNMENIYKPDGDLLNSSFPISLDAMLDNICIYWFTGTITSSMRLYAESLGSTSELLAHVQRQPTPVAAGLTVYPHDLLVLPPNMVHHKYTNLLTYSTAREGGHFAAMEVPELFASDLWTFVSAVEADIKRRNVDSKK